MPTLYLIAALFNQAGFMPHGHCYLWKPALVWLHAGTDSIIGLAYVSISVSLYLLMRRIRLPFGGMFLAFGLFIGACGLTHFMEVWTLWRPDYWFSGFVKFVTAGASIATAMLLYPVTPQVVRVAAEAKLAEQHRLRLEAYSVELEARVAERTAALEASLSEKERLVESLRDAEARLRGLMEAAPILIWISDHEGKTLYVNDQWVEYTGLPKENAAAMGWREVLAPDDLAPQTEAWLGAVATGRPMEREARLRRRDGALRVHQLRAVPVGADGHRLWIGTAADIDDQKRAVTLRDEFLSVASHELRTPLTSIAMRIQTLARQAHQGALKALPDDKLAQALDAASRQVGRLTELTDTLLDVSRITAGHFTLHRAAVPLADVLREQAEAFADEAARAGATLELALTPVTAAVDRGRLEQVVANLISNALKFGRGAPVRLELTRRGDQVVIAVRNQGPPIPEAERETIFERFERGAAERAVGGLGLGLYISRGIVERHGGRIRVESGDEGTTFIVELPVGEA